MLAAPMTFLAARPSNGAWKSVLEQPSSNNNDRHRDTTALESKLHDSSLRNVTMPKRNPNAIVLNIDDDELSQDSTIIGTVVEDHQQQMLRRKKKSTAGEAGEAPGHSKSSTDKPTTPSKSNERRPTRSSSRDGRKGKSSGGGGEGESAAQESAVKSENPSRSRSKERSVSRSSSKDGRRGKSSEGKHSSSKEPGPPSSSGAATGEEEVRRHRASSREGRRRSTSKDATPRSSSKDPKPTQSSSRDVTKATTRSSSRDAARPKRSSSKDPTKPSSSAGRSSSRDARPRRSTSEDGKPSRSSSKEGRPARSSSRDLTRSARSSSKDAKPSSRSSSKEPSQSKSRSSSKDGRRSTGSSSRDVTRPQRSEDLISESVRSEPGPQRGRPSLADSTSRDVTQPKTSGDPISESARSEPGPQTRGRPSLADMAPLLKRSNRSLSRERPPSSRALLGASSAAAESTRSLGQEPRRANSMTHVPDTPENAAAKMAKMYGISAEVAPSAADVVSRQTSLRRMPKGSVQMDAGLVSTPAGSKTSVSSRSISLDSSRNGKPESSPSQSNTEDMASSFRSPKADSKPASDRTNSDESSCHGTMALKSPSRPGEPPAKRPQRYRGRKTDRVPPTPKTPMVKTASDRFLDVGGGSAGAMGLSVPHRSLSPVSNRKKKAAMATLGPSGKAAPTASTPITPKALSSRDFRTQDISGSKLGDSFLNFGKDDWGCKTLGASTCNSSPIPEGAAKVNSGAQLSRTTHSDSGGRRAGKKSDMIPKRFNTTHDKRPDDTTEDDSIMKFNVDEWASDDDDEEEVAEIPSKTRQTIQGKVPSALDTLKNKSKQKGTRVAAAGKPKKAAKKKSDA